jgi:hypothetical protein
MVVFRRQNETTTFAKKVVVFVRADAREAS